METFIIIIIIIIIIKNSSFFLSGWTFRLFFVILSEPRIVFVSHHLLTLCRRGYKFLQVYRATSLQAAISPFYSHFIYNIVIKTETGMGCITHGHVDLSFVLY